MTISTRVQHEIDVDSGFRLPPTLAAPMNDHAHTTWSLPPLTSITAPSLCEETIKQENESPRTLGTSRRRVNLWSTDEHERFLHGLELYPQGPWKLIAEVVGTRTTRQTMTHAQKYRQKIERHQRMNEAMGRLLNSVRSPLLFEGVAAIKKSRGRQSPSPPTVSPIEATQPLFDWDHAHDPEFHELLASLAPAGHL